MRDVRNHRPNAAQLAKRCESFKATPANEAKQLFRMIQKAGLRVEEAKELVRVSGKEFSSLVKLMGKPYAESVLTFRLEVLFHLDKLLAKGNHVRTCTDGATAAPAGA